MLETRSMASFIVWRAMTWSGHSAPSAALIQLSCRLPTRRAESKFERQEKGADCQLAYLLFLDFRCSTRCSRYIPKHAQRGLTALHTSRH